MLSLISKSLSSPKKQNKRASIVNSNYNSSVSISRNSLDNNKLMSEFDDTEIVKDTPLSFVVRKVRQLENLTVEDFLIVQELDKDTLINLLIEYNSALRFNFAYKNKTFR